MTIEEGEKSSHHTGEQFFRHKAPKCIYTYDQVFLIITTKKNSSQKI